MQFLMIIKKNKSVGWFIHLAVLLTGCMFITYFFKTPLATYYLYLGSLLFLFVLFTLAFNFLKSKHSLIALKLLYAVASSLILFVASIHSDNIYSYGPLVADTVSAIYQTSFTEMIDYLLLYVSNFALSFYVAWSVLTISSILTIQQNNGGKIVNKIFFTVIFSISLILLNFGRKDIEIIVNEALAYSQTLSEFSNSRASVTEIYNLDSLTSDFEGNIIVAIGESTSRHHFGIYNYVRNTTPYLSSISDKLYIYNNIISTHSHTIPSLTDALSLSNRHAVQNINQLPDLITIAKKTGFFTAWLSNQNAIGIWDNGVAAIARQADIIKYHDKNSGTKRERSIYDEILVDSLKELLKSNKSKKKLIFLHMMATHFPYCDVIPNNFESDYKYYNGIQSGFQMLGGYMAYLIDTRGKEYANYHLRAIDCYDRAVKYVDKVLEKTIKIANSDSNPTFLLYLSDHGEAPLLGTAHESRVHSHWHIEIPFLAWLNDSFKKTYPDIVSDIQKNVSKKGSLVDLSYSILDIAKVTNINDLGKRSLFSKNYEAFNRTSLHRTRGYDLYDVNSDQYEKTNALLHEISQRYGTKKYEKIWAHRVNSFGSLLEAKNLFAGVELDLVYNTDHDELYVYHPPAPNLEITIDQMLIQDNSNLMYWFDLKNLSEINVENTLKILEKINQKYKIKDRVILESGTLDRSIRQLANHGWHLSYYLPTDKILKCIKTCTFAKKQKLANELLYNRQKYGFAAVSIDSRLISFFERFLLVNVTKNKLPVYTWNQKLNISKKENMQELVRLLKKNYIKVVLVNFPSSFDI